MASLSDLGLCCNNLIGHILTSLGNLMTLVVLSTGQNLLTGPILKELGNLSPI
jgi:hypothetical protein